MFAQATPVDVSLITLIINQRHSCHPGQEISWKCISNTPFGLLSFFLCIDGTQRADFLANSK
jgi:hypothetical protein